MSTPFQPLLNETLAGRAPPSPPASPILSRNDQNRPPEPSPASTEPPSKRRKIDSDNINNKTDEEVWDLPDSDILDALRLKWQADVYDHFTPSLVRDLSTTPRSIKIVLTCKFNDPRHNSSERRRDAKGSFNTSNLASSVKTCVGRDPARAALIPLPIASAGTIPYSEAMHRTLIALRCASSKRSFNQVEDKWYRMEVAMLRPGTVVPSADTVAKDVQRLYVLVAQDVKAYFLKRGRDVHGVVDGWTAPIAENYLGAGIIWEDMGRIFEIVWNLSGELTDRHTGDYLASQLADTLNRYGLAEFVSICRL
ncbi:hypothetical protein R3P38DRAFT_2543185 [Favolaschia claudopus]|uniref:Uncharacterized protein n=1 Tax=Favolaschia claudopus TaxID=2862362 RepID=A0AAW0ATE7_9AGAR